MNNFPIHEYKVPSNGGGQPFTRRFTCLSEVNQICPGCAAGLKVKRRGVYNLIQRNRPVLQRGADKKVLKNPDGSYIVIGYQDEVVVANVGGPTAEMLRKADGQYHGLMSRDFVVQYSGETFQAWNIVPVMDEAGNAIATPMSEIDQALAAKKHDLDKYMKPPTPEEAQKIVMQYGQNSGAQQVAPAGMQQGGFVPPQGNAMQAPGAANQFLAGVPLPQQPQQGYAQPPAPPVGAFGAAQQVAPPPAPPIQAPLVVQQPPAPVQPQQPVQSPAPQAPPVPQAVPPVQQG